MRVAKNNGKRIGNTQDKKHAGYQRSHGNRAKDLRGIRLAVVFVTSFLQPIMVRKNFVCNFSLIHKQLSPKEKLDLIKNNFSQNKCA